MGVEPQVTAYYTRGGLEEKILRTLESAGKNLEQLRPDDLAALDNFHVGGEQATADLAAFMGLRAGMHLLDIGCGIGGPARFFAGQGYRVTGIDVTDEFVGVARSLTHRVKLDQQAQFRQGSALELPFEPGTFDGAYMIHVGMNLADKAGVFREVARVLKRGGRFAIFDIMSSGSGALAFPLPWATDPATSFVASAEDYRQALETAGFHIDHQRERRQFAIELTKTMMERIAALPVPALGAHLLMGEQAPLMLKNVMAAIGSGALEPVELVAAMG